MSGRWKALLCAMLFMVLPYFFFYSGAFQVDLIEEGEGVAYYFPLKAFSASIIRTGSYPLWNPYVLTGYPLLGSIEAGSFYPPAAVFLLFRPTVAFNLFMYLHYALAGVFMFVYVRSLKISHVAASLSGIVFMFSGFMVAQMGHSSCQNAAVWLPLIFFCLEKARGKPSFGYFVLGTSAYACQILAGFPQLAVYTAILVLLFLCFYREKWLLATGLGVLVVGTCLAAVQLLPSAELTNLSSRGQTSYDFFTRESFPPGLLPLFLFPYLFGALSVGFYGTPYWGAGNPVECAPYIGILPLSLGVIALVSLGREDRNVRFWSLIALLALLLALGKNTPIYRIMYRVPVYNLFRVPARHLLELHFAVAVLSGIGLAAITRHPRQRPAGTNRAISIVSWALAAIVVVSVALIPMIRLSSPAGMEKHLGTFSLSNPAMYLPVIILLLAIFVLHLLKKKGNNRVLSGVILAMVFFDLFSFGHFFNVRDASSRDMTDREYYRGPVRYLLDKEGDPYSYRTVTMSTFPSEDPMEIVHPNTNLLYPIPSLNTFSALIPNSHLRLLNMNAAGGFVDATHLLTDNKILSMLNVKYVISTLLAPEDLRLVSGPDELAVVQRSFPMKPGASYRASLLARAASEPAGDLVVGIVVGDWFGQPQVVLRIPAAAISQRYERFFAGLR